MTELGGGSSRIWKYLKETSGCWNLPPPPSSVGSETHRAGGALSVLDPVDEAATCRFTLAATLV